MSSRSTSAVTTGDGSAKGSSIHLRLLLSLLFGGATASVVLLKFAPVPFFWIFSTWAVVLFLVMFGVEGSWPRVILLNLGIVSCLLAASEAYLVAHEYASPVTPPDFWLHDDVLGWAPPKARTFHVFKYNPTGFFHGPRWLLFDDYYTIDPGGLRIAPPYQKNGQEGTALFFGCSFTFGEGVRDDETLPYQVGIQSEGRYRTFNFAFEGYGAAQMLAAIEHGIVSRDVDTGPRYAFYVAIPDHVWRVAGRVAWGNHAPRYVLDSDGTVQ